MKREDVYQQIDRIRTEQDEKWSDRSQYTRSAAHILVLDTQMQKLHAEWYASKPSEIVKRFISIAATAVRALEELNPEEYPQKLT
jgi:hypothetical protein